MFPSPRNKALRDILFVLLWALPGTCSAVFGQVIEFTSNGLNYMTLSREGLTLMYAPLPMTIRDFAVIQISYSNGSGENQPVSPNDFVYTAHSGKRIRAASEEVVVRELYQKARQADVVKLQAAYEKALYGSQPIRSSNGYESRRRAAIARGPEGLRAAAAASALSLVTMQLKPGESTDGVVFFPYTGEPLDPGTLDARLANGKRFQFPVR